jgi:streptogramin lyase
MMARGYRLDNLRCEKGQPDKLGESIYRLWIDEQGTIYVCDRENSRIQLFSLEGRYTAQWGDLHRPADIYIDANNTVYVSELKPSVVIMDKEGNKIARWDRPNGHGLWAADSHDDIYLAGVPGHAVHKDVPGQLFINMYAVPLRFESAC